MTPDEGHTALERFVLVLLLMERGGQFTIPMSELDEKLAAAEQWYLQTMIREGGFTFKLISRDRQEELKAAGWPTLESR